ncbi:MAG: hypothetical protein SFV21_06805 [Rhodospirillaceae bacterium]|nr:hypothetical protein [Rhodospirillaceae bacterium]
MATPKTDRPTYAAEAIPSDIKNSVFLGNPILDNLVSAMVAMGAEVWAAKRRIKVVEAVLAKNGIGAEQIEQYMPTEEEKAAWEADRDRFVALAFGPLTHEGTLGPTTSFPPRS